MAWVGSGRPPAVLLVQVGQLAVQPRQQRSARRQGRRELGVAGANHRLPGESERGEALAERLLEMRLSTAGEHGAARRGSMVDQVRQHPVDGTLGCGQVEEPGGVSPPNEGRVPADRIAATPDEPHGQLAVQGLDLLEGAGELGLVPLDADAEPP